MLHTMFGPGNRWTTGLSVILAALYYLQTEGAQLPTTRDGWVHFAVGMLIAAFGALTKSSLVGSKPGDPPALTVGTTKTATGEPVLPTAAATPEAKKAVTETGGHVIP